MLPHLPHPRVLHPEREKLRHQLLEVDPAIAVDVDLVEQPFRAERLGAEVRVTGRPRQGRAAPRAHEAGSAQMFIDS